MDLQAARALALLIESYIVIGLAFAAVFLPVAAARVDPRLARSPWTVRLLILPGVAALWPVFARRWVSGAAAPDERNPHRDAAQRDARP